MSIELVKKLYENTATIDDVVKVKQHLTPTYHGMRGGIGSPFFISEIGKFHNKSVGIVLIGNSVASYKGDIGNEMDFEIKYLSGILKDSKTHFEGSMTKDNLIFGVMKFNDNPDDHQGFYIFPSVDAELFKNYIENSLKINSSHNSSRIASSSAPRRAYP